MAKSDVEELTQKTVQKGGILAKLYLDMESNNKDELQPLLTEIINNRLLKTPGVVYCFGSIEEPVKSGDMYITSAVVTTLVKEAAVLFNISFLFAPAGIEILKPDKGYTFKINELQSILVNLSQISADYAQYIASHVLKGEELEKVQQDLRNRHDLGKRLLEKKDDKGQQAEA